MATGGRDESQAANSGVGNGTIVPNRIFVGGITIETDQEDLRKLFSMYGNVKATNIIFNKGGESKGYGFVTFESDEEAQKVLKMIQDSKDLTLKGRKLNVAPAVKKRPYNRNNGEYGSMDVAPVVWASSNSFPTSHGYPNRENSSYSQATWPLFWHQPVYFPQQYPYYQVPQQGYPQYVCNVAPQEYQYPNSGQLSGLDFAETASADSGESGKNRSRAPTPAPINQEYDRHRPTQPKPFQDSNFCIQKLNSGYASASNYLPASSVQQLHHVLAKTVNGVTVMAYPAHYLMGNHPRLVHMKEGNDSDNVMLDLGYMHSQVASSALTPPSTPMASTPCEFHVNTSMESSRKN